VALNPKLNQADGMHPNPAGVKVVVTRMLPYVKRLLAEKGQNTGQKTGK
jgi:acyl-CoA thioesterase-1